MTRRRAHLAGCLHIMLAVLVLWATPIRAQTAEDIAAYQQLMQELQTRWQAGPSEELLQLALDGLPLVERATGPRSQELLNYMGGIVMMQGALGRATENRAYLERMLDIAQSTLPENNPGLLRTKSDLGLMLAGVEAYRAEKLAREAYETATAYYPEGEYIRAHVTMNLSQIYVRMKRFDEALPLLDQVTNAQRMAMTQGIAPNAQMAQVHVETLLSAGRFEDAAALASEMLDALSAAPPRFTELLRLRLAVALIGRQAPGDLAQADDIMTTFMLNSPEPPMEAVEVRLFGLLGVNYVNLRTPAQTPDVILHVLQMIRDDPRIPPVYEAGLASAMMRMDMVRFGPEVELTSARMAEVFPEDHPINLALALDVAGYYAITGRLDDARVIAAAVREAAAAASDQMNENTASSLLWEISMRQNDLDAAVELGERQITILTDQFGATSEPTLRALVRHVNNLMLAGRNDEADALAERGLAQASAAWGNDHILTANFLFMRGQGLIRQGENAQAGQFMQRALAVAERVLPPEDSTIRLYRFTHLMTMMFNPDADELRTTAATLLDELEIYSDPGDPMVPAVEMFVAMLDLIDTEDSAAALVRMNTLMDEFQQVAPGQEQFLVPFFVIQALTLMDNDPIAGLDTIDALRTRFGEDAVGNFDQSTLAIIMEDSGLPAHAAEYYQRGLNQMLARSDVDQTSLLRFSRRLAHLQLREPDLFDGYETMDAFQLIQWPLERRAGRALELAALRFAADDAELAEQLRERQDISAEIETLSAALQQAYVGSDTERVIALQAEFSDLQARQKTLEADIRDTDPGFGLISGAEPLTTDQVADLLTPGEALLLIAPTQFNAFDEVLPGIAFLVRWDGRVISQALNDTYVHSTGLRYVRCQIHWDKDFCVWRRSGDEEDPEPQQQAQADVGEPSTPSGTRAAESLTAPTGPVYDFDFEAAHELYSELVGPVEHGLDGIDHLLFVPGDETMAAMPLGLLVRSPLPEGLDQREAFQQAHWLIRDMAISVLPTVSSLKAQRGGAARPSQATDPFLGVGDPVIGTAARIDCGQVQLAGLSRGLGDAADPGALMSRGGGNLSNVDRIRRLARLPDTRCELEAIRDRLGGGQLLMDAQATEGRIKSLDRAGSLARYRVVSFATHGLVAGEAGASEPALVLTPPDVATRNDDGLLTASEIATFDLDADLVMLSACNTAAGANAGGEALSGLARAFFYAGARQMLVSHWPVESDAAVRLTTSAIDKMSTGQSTRFEFAMRDAILDILDNPDSSLRELRPAHWGPFSLVGTAG